MTVAGEDICFARNFGPSGSNEGVEDPRLEMRRVVIILRRPARYHDVVAAANGVGRRCDDDDSSAVHLLEDRDVRDLLDERGFDGFSDDDVVSDEEHRAVVAWHRSKVVLLPEVEAGYGTLSEEGDALAVRLTLRGRDLVLDRATAFASTTDFLKSLLPDLASEGISVEFEDALPGARLRLVGPEDRVFGIDVVDPYRMAETGALLVPETSVRPAFSGP